MNNIRHPAALLRLENRTASNGHLQDEQYQTPDRTASVRKPHCIKWSLIRWTTSHPTTLLQLGNRTASNGQVNIITFFVVSLHFSFNTSLHFISFFLFFVWSFGFPHWRVVHVRKANHMVEGNEPQHNSKWTSFVNNFQTSPYNFST